jgi:uncharacterized SAM-binding protein YcdF (DUF218 family)
MAADAAAVDGAGVIILLGHESDVTGLSETARARCAKAAALAAQSPEYLILPTGAFGAFNKNDRPHGDLLREQLVSLGVDRERILPYTNSSNTVEDALCARRIIADLAEPQLIVVTSRFHMRRAAHIFRRVFPEYNLEFVESDSVLSDTVLLQRESEKLRTLMAEWIDVPLYGAAEQGREFPITVYQAAAAEQKHYDTISAAVITGLFIVFGYPYAVSVRPEALKPLLFLLSSLAIVALALLYNRMAWFARIARRILHNIEVEYGAGFSLVYPRQDRSGKPNAFWRPVLRGASIWMTVNIMAMSMIVIQLAVAVLLIARIVA